MGIDRFLFGDPTIAFLKRSLDVQKERAAVIAGNLANVDTPGYQARDIDFAEVLATADTGLGGGGHLLRTNPEHLPAAESADETISVDADRANIRVDNNTVNQDKEMAKLGESRMLYEASMNALAAKLKIINAALNGRV